MHDHPLRSIYPQRQRCPLRERSQVFWGLWLHLPDRGHRREVLFQWLKPSEDVARLAGIRFINISEPGKGIVLDAARLKTMTGKNRLKY